MRYDSAVVEHLDGFGEPRLVPESSPERWTVLRLQAFADGLLESTIRVWRDVRRDEGSARALRVSPRGPMRRERVRHS